ncbi:MAG: hypothetical protein FWC27_10800, partial [Firmicutes bacterium]|nr:hypothetical protein [Bacillota bacterium]
AFGCGKDEPETTTTEPGTTTEWTYATLPETETEYAEPTDAEPSEDDEASATRATTTSRIPTLSGGASSTRSTTTTRSSTVTTITTTTTRQAGNAINIGSTEAALSAFNSAVRGAANGKAGFAKSHLITAQDWTFDPAFIDSLTIPGLSSFFDPNEYLAGALNTALGKGLRTATAGKGSANSLLANSSFTMADMKDVTYTGSAGGQQWTITMLVKDGETRQKRGGGLTGSSPIDRGPLNLAAGVAGLYDHMAADKIFSLVKSSFAIVNAEPIDISESTSQVKLVAKLDTQGRLTELQVSFNQTINLREITVLNGAQSFTDNQGSSAVTVTYDGFVY